VSCLILERLPALAGKIPHRPLTAGTPTPVERAPTLGEHVWIKRDDATGGAAAYGGNKVRKLEFLLADALARGRRAVLTLGGTGSNHVLATAIYARAVGLEATHAVLFPQPHTEAVERRLARFRALGVRVARTPGKLSVPFAGVARAIASLARGHGAPYLIGAGGSSPLGSLGYVNAALELAAQIERGDCPCPRAIYVALGSGGTAAGLIVGLRLAGLAARTRVQAVRVVPAPWTSARQTASLATRTAALLGEPPVRTTDFDMVDDQLGRAYGQATPAADAAVARAAGAGLALETTYTGKTLAALLARDHRSDVLFWNTYCHDPGAQD
jgi:D-cysteine desulfhydrase